MTRKKTTTRAAMRRTLISLSLCLTCYGVLFLGTVRTVSSSPSSNPAVQATTTKTTGNWTQAAVAASSDGSEPFRNCGGVIKGSEAGFIMSPNFPGQFPVPINCRWTLEAPAGKVVVVYLTQFYLRDGFKATEYAFLDSSLNIGKRELGPFSFDDQGTAVIITSKPILVLELEVFDATNIHVRVMEFFLDVYGFNVTYQMMAKDSREHLGACSAATCSFAGTCYASSDFQLHYCDCFPGFFGPRCQWGPACNPSKNINPCKNSGSCRYLHGGTLVSCECRPGFSGLDCGDLGPAATSKAKTNSAISSGSSDCSGKERSCEGDHCFLDNYGRPGGGGQTEQEDDLLAVADETKCCSQGNPSDGRGCVPLGKVRYVVGLKLYDSNVDIAHLDKARFHELKSGIELAVLSTMKPYLQNSNSHLRVLQFKPSAEVELHFFHNEEDEQKIRKLFQEKLRTGRIGRYAVDKNFLEIHSEPALNIVSIESSASMPIMEKNELNITCNVRGSQDLRVQWFKDGLAINFNGSVERAMSERLMPRNSQGLFTSELFIERLNVLDSGLFTCSARDFGFALNSSFRIHVTVLPPPSVSPLTRTVWEGERVLVTCFSREDIALRKYGYNWLKNGEILNPVRENEQIEDLFPTGSRIIINKAARSATYTCLATTPAGTAFQESAITVVPRLNASSPLPTCPMEHRDNIDWPTTGANSDFVQPCPLGYEEGMVKRRCQLVDSAETRWAEPNFSKCLTSKFLDIRQQFRKLRIGYAVSTVTSLVRDLANYLNSHALMRFEGEPIVEFLTHLFTYLQSARLDKAELELSCEYALDILSLVLDHPGSISQASDLSMAHHMVVEFTLLRTTTKTSIYSQVGRRNFWAEVVRVEPEDAVLEMPLARSHNRVKKRKSNGVASVLDTMNQIPAWLSDTVELNMSRWQSVPLSVQIDRQDFVLAVFYRNLGSFLPKHFLLRRRISDIEYQIHSRLVTVALLNNSSRNIGQQSKLKIKAHLRHHNTTDYIPPADFSEIACGLAELSDRIGFHTQNCRTGSTTSEATVCLCDLTGTYAIILTSQIRQRLKSDSLLIDLEAAAGCAACALFVALALLVLLAQPRRLFRPINALRGQVCLAIIGGQLALLALLHPELPKTMTHHIYSAAMFFQLVSFSLQVSFCATTYSQVCTNNPFIKNPEAKISFLGWAIPISVEGASLAAQALEGFPAREWTFAIGSRLFYSTTLTCSMLTLCHFFLYASVRIEFIRRHRVDTSGPGHGHCSGNSDNGQSARSRAGTVALDQSLAITLCLGAALISAVLYENYPGDVNCRHAFATLSTFLGLVTFACYASCSDDQDAKPAKAISATRRDTLTGPDLIDAAMLDKASSRNPHEQLVVVPMTELQHTSLPLIDRIVAGHGQIYANHCGNHRHVQHQQGGKHVTIQDHNHVGTSHAAVIG